MPRAGRDSARCTGRDFARQSRRTSALPGRRLVRVRVAQQCRHDSRMDIARHQQRGCGMKKIMKPANGGNVRSLLQSPKSRTTETTHRCVSVLLKPFASNLLFARIGRLLRERSATLRDRSARVADKTRHLLDRSNLLIQGTNRVWPTTHCAYCSHSGVTSFEFASHRRAWYACLQCKKVCLGKRQE